MTTDYLSAVRLDDQLLSACELHKGALAVVDDNYTLSFQELSERSAQVAESIVRAGHRPGLPVVVAVDNRWTDIVAQLAVWRTDGVVVPVHRTTPARVLRHIAERAGARLVVSPGQALPQEWPLGSGEPLEWVHGLRTKSEPPAELDSRQALVAFTSGSTGRAKGVVLSHSALGSKLEAISNVIPFSTGSNTLQVLHLNFTFGQWTTLLTLVRGGTVHLVQRFVARDVLRRLMDQSVDRIAVVPTMLRLILADLDDAPLDLNREALAECPSPGLWIAGGEPLAAGLGRRVLETFPRARLADVFGLSETSTSDIILTPDAYQAGAGTIGRPSPGVQVRIVAENGVDQSAGGVGELWIKTPFLMTGYLADPESTAAAKSGDWFRTGDLARVTETGNIELVGRSKFLILRGGHKLSPLSIEGIISEHPACRGACVFGTPDAVLGERIAVLFKPAAGVRVTPDEIRAWAKTRLQPYEVPDEINLVDELPLGGTGKMDRLSAREFHKVVTSELGTQ
jgi:acyl-CoA synthetase (AMP-forming)/AMP-acid ligase II